MTSVPDGIATEQGSGALSELLAAGGQRSRDAFAGTGRHRARSLHTRVVPESYTVLGYKEIVRA